MKKINLLIVTCCILALGALAQKPKVNGALFSLQEGKILDAKTQIDEAMKDSEMQAWAKAWQTKGDVYKAIYESKVYFPQNPNALFEAKDAYFKAYELETNPKKKGDVTEPLETLGAYFYNEGLSAFQNEKWADSYKQFAQNRAINEFMMSKGLSNKLDTSAIFATAVAAFNAKMNAEAQPLLEKLVEYNYPNEIVYETLAGIYEASDDKSKLVALLEKGLVKYPENKSMQMMDLNYNIQSNKVNESIQKLEAALQKDPDNPAMLFNLALMYDQLHQDIKAITFYDKATKAKPDYADAYANAGALYFNSAVEINKIINNDDKNQIDSFLAVLGKQELFTIADVDAALKEKNYSNLLSSFANVSDVAAFKEKVSKINDIIKYDLLQGARNVLYNKALPYLEKSYSIDPKNKGIRGALKEIYARMNMLDKAASLKDE